PATHFGRGCRQGTASVQRCAAARSACRAKPPSQLCASRVAALRSSGGALSLDEADDDQKYDRTDHRVNDRADEAGERHESQLREQPDADESADNSDDDVPDQSETKTAHDLPGQPACDRADDNHDDNAVYSNHDILPWPGTRPAPTSSAT